MCAIYGEEIMNHMACSHDDTSACLFNALNMIP